MIDIVRFDGDFFELGFSQILPAKQFTIVEAGTLDKNRSLLSDKRIDILLGAERVASHDSFHHRHSGFNQVLLPLAKKNQIAMGFSLSDLSRVSSDQRIVLLGRMMQNVRLCRKFKVKMVLASFAKTKWEMCSAHDLLSFGITLGMTPQEAKDALSFTKKSKALEVIS